MKNKKVFVTGASSGIGEACAEVFAREGADLILLARREEKLNEVAKRLCDTYNVEIKTFQCDVRNRDEVNEVISSLDEGWENIDVLINNAGLASGLGTVQEGDVEDWEIMIDTNLKGLLYVSRAVLPLMVARQTGTVVNIGSVAGETAYPNGNVYCGTKSFVKILSDGMNIDLNGTGVRVTNIAPGMVETEFSVVRFHGDKDKADSVYKGVTPLSGMDIAEAALYAASLPPHVNMQYMLIMPNDQANAYTVNRKK
jgi:NADP-dependent 3-hydroxy acid dehydrogenase YdfG